MHEFGRFGAHAGEFWANLMSEPLDCVARQAIFPKTAAPRTGWPPSERPVVSLDNAAPVRRRRTKQLATPFPDRFRTGPLDPLQHVDGNFDRTHRVGRHGIQKGVGRSLRSACRREHRPAGVARQAIQSR